MSHKSAYEGARTRMIQELKSLGIKDKVLKVMDEVPREVFLAPAFKTAAYENRALPIGDNQTISQPQVVSLMTHALDVEPAHKVLEIGTGCGYQAAILAKLARRVFTVERFETLSRGAEKRLHDLGIYNVATKVGDGTLGWAEQAPFDRIMVTAAGPYPPQALLDQLAEGGILIMPVGEVGVDNYQKLMRYYRRTDGSVGEYYIGDVKFVPLVGEQGVKEHKNGKKVS